MTATPISRERDRAPRRGGGDADAGSPGRDRGEDRQHGHGDRGDDRCRRRHRRCCSSHATPWSAGESCLEVQLVERRDRHGCGGDGERAGSGTTA